MAKRLVPRPIVPYESVIGADDALGPRLSRPLVYVFEHKMLPQMFFLNHPATEQALRSMPTPGQAFVHFWSKSAVFCESHGLWPEGLTEDEDGYLGYARPLWDLVACVPRFEFDYNVWTVRTPAPKAVGEAYFVALCMPATERHEGLPAKGLKRCFTLELSVDDTVCLCEWTQEDSHLNYGTMALQTSVGFTELVLQRLRA